MKKTKTIGFTLLALLLISSLAFFAGCKDPEEKPDNKVTEYDITVTQPATGGTFTVKVDTAAAVSANTKSAEGKTITLEASPASGYHLGNFGVTPAVQQSGTDNTRTFTMPANAIAITATFVSNTAPKFGITITESEGGTITADVEEAAEGDTVTLTIDADDGWELKSISITGGIQTSGTGNTRTFVMPGNAVTITYVFEEEEEEVSISVSAKYMGDFTYENNADQKAWGFGGYNGDLFWSDFVAAKYLVLETKGGNPGGFGGIQVILQGDGNSYAWAETQIMGDWTSFSRPADESVYLFIKLDTLGPYAAFAGGTRGQIFIASYPLTGLMLENAYLLADVITEMPSDAVNIAHSGNTYGFISKNVELTVTGNAFPDPVEPGYTLYKDGAFGVDFTPAPWETDMVVAYEGIQGPNGGDVLRIGSRSGQWGYGMDIRGDIDWSTVNALSFYVRASEAMTLQEFGLMDDAGQGTDVRRIHYTGENGTGVTVGNTWQKIVIPLPPTTSAIPARQQAFKFWVSQSEGVGKYLYFADILLIEEPAITYQVVIPAAITVSPVAVTSIASLVNPYKLVYSIGGQTATLFSTDIVPAQWYTPTFDVTGTGGTVSGDNINASDVVGSTFNLTMTIGSVVSNPLVGTVNVHSSRIIDAFDYYPAQVNAPAAASAANPNFGFTFGGTQWWHGLVLNAVDNNSAFGAPRRAAQVGGSGAISVQRTNQFVDFINNITPFKDSHPMVSIWVFARAAEATANGPYTFQLRTGQHGTGANNLHVEYSAPTFTIDRPHGGRGGAGTDFDSNWTNILIPLSSFTRSGGQGTGNAAITDLDTIVITGWRISGIANQNFWIGANIELVEAPASHLVTSNVTGTGTGTVTIPAFGYVGHTVNISVAPAAGSTLVSITATGAELTGSGNNRSFVMPDNPVTIDTVIDLMPTFAISEGTVTGGTLVFSPNPAYQGQTITVTGTPTAAGDFIGTISTNPTAAVSGTGNTRTFTMPASAITVDAAFIEPPAPILVETFEAAGTAGATIAAAGNTWATTNDVTGWFTAKDNADANLFAAASWDSDVAPGSAGSFSAKIDFSLPATGGTRNARFGFRPYDPAIDASPYTHINFFVKATRAGTYRIVTRNSNNSDVETTFAIAAGEVNTWVEKIVAAPAARNAINYIAFQTGRADQGNPGAGTTFTLWVDDVRFTYGEPTPGTGGGEPVEVPIDMAAGFPSGEQNQKFIGGTGTITANLATITGEGDGGGKVAIALNNWNGGYDMSAFDGIKFEYKATHGGNYGLDTGGSTVWSSGWNSLPFSADWTEITFLFADREKLWGDGSWDSSSIFVITFEIYGAAGVEKTVEVRNLVGLQK